MLSMSPYPHRSDYAFPLASPTSVPSIQNHVSGENEPSHAHSYSSHSDHAPPFSPTLERPDSSHAGDDDSSAHMGSPPREDAAAPAPPRSVPARKNSNNANAVRKRTSRACDQCNQLRTKCDGKHPCGHCTETGLKCEYARMPKKRGKVSKKDLARQQALRETLAEEAMRRGAQDSSNTVSAGLLAAASSQVPANVYNGLHIQNVPNGMSMQDTNGQPRTQYQPSSVQEVAFSTPSPSSNAHSHRSALSHTGQNLGGEPQQLSGVMEAQYHNMNLDAFGGMGPPTDSTHGHIGDFRTPVDFSNLYMGMGGLPGQPIPLEGMDFPVQSPSAATSLSGGMGSQSGIKHPVLIPLLPFLKNIMTPSLANELLEHFFVTSSPEDPNPTSPYHIAAIFRKKSFIGPQNPRRCSPALLASILWSAAWTSDARPLTSPPSARARMCQKLLNLCIFLLNPLIHGERLGKNSSPDAERNGVSKAHPMGVQEMLIDDDVPVKISSGTVDDVATYMHIAIVISASEDKGASLRWWTAAWNLAKELRLGRELGHNARSVRPNSFFLNDNVSDPHDDEMALDQPISTPITEEEREERRRIWWVLYLVDRHLALCYNRHLTILDSECVDLLRPMDEMAWQEGQFEPLESPYAWPNPRTAGRFEFTGPSIFGYFLPLSTILGEIVDLHQRRMHPFLQGTNSSRDLSGYDAEIRAICVRQLETFQKSMIVYRDRHHATTNQQAGVGPGSGAGPTDRATAGATSNRPHLTEAQFQIATACAYATHLMHVLHILLNDRWDPVSLLDDDDLWISTPAFQAAMGHAVAGADALGDVLKYDPELGFMPYLFGIYLLQGSFLLLLTADKLGTDANEKTVSACETVVRGTEACVVTLNTEYQRHFRKVMQSALAQVRGRNPQDAEQSRRRREILSIYRWSGDGGGLAV